MDSSVLGLGAVAWTDAWIAAAPEAGLRVRLVSFCAIPLKVHDRVIADGIQAPDDLGEGLPPLSPVLDVGGQLAGASNRPPRPGELADRGLCLGEHR